MDLEVYLSNLFWLDFETTGFTDLKNHAVYTNDILEVGMVITDRDFNLLETKTIVVHADESSYEKADDFVRKMHTNNGLWDECYKSGVSLVDAEQQAIDFALANGVTLKGSPLCGNGITFDRMFLEAQMPALNAILHYRNMDISAVKEFIRTINPEVDPVKRQSHRALDDILESVEEARLYRKMIIRGVLRTE